MFFHEGCTASAGFFPYGYKVKNPVTNVGMKVGILFILILDMPFILSIVPSLGFRKAIAESGNCLRFFSYQVGLISGVHQFGNESCPPCLVRSTNTSSVVAVKVFIE